MITVKLRQKHRIGRACKSIKGARSNNSGKVGRRYHARVRAGGYTRPSYSSAGRHSKGGG